MAYREQADVSIPVDAGELEAIRIKEQEQTKRRREELRAEAAEDRRKKLATFFSYDGVVAICGLCAVLTMGVLGTIAIMGAYAHWFGR